MGKQGTISVFKRLFIMALCLLIAVYVVLTGFFVTFVSQQHEVDMSGHVSRVTNSASVVEQQIQAVSNVQLQLFNDSRVAQLAQGLYGDDYEKSQMILDLLSTIQNTQAINSIIEDIIILFPMENIELSARSGYHKISFNRETYSTQRSNESSRLALRDRKLELNISFPLPVSIDENYIPDFEIRIILSSKYLEDYIESFHNRDLEGAFWVISENGEETILFSEDEEETSHMQHWLDEWQGNGSPDFLVKETSCEHGEFYFTSQCIDSYNLILVTYQNTLAIAWKVGRSLWVITGVILIMGLLFGLITYWANHAVNKPIRKIMEAFEKVRSGELDIRIFHKSNDEFGYIYDSFNATVSDIEELIENIKEQKILLQNAELMQLQSQINPHFLYNSFYNIKFMAHNEDYEQIETFVTALAKYYRFINKETHLDVELEKEVAHMENYIEIQQMRFGDKISVKKDMLPTEVRNIKVPKLILQPIIENAYNYGLKDTLEGGLLQINYRKEGNFLYIEIEDNGNTLTPEKLEQMRRQMYTYEGHAINHALTNIQRRLMLSCGSNCGLSLEIGESGGLKVVLCLNTNVQI
jgi:two-component system sensor histidine kinase YesM